MRHLPPIVAVSTVLVAGAVGEGAAAQDTHYWTEQFGARADLLGGTIVGDVADPSAAFYNPGALGLVDDVAFMITANGFQYTWITLSRSDPAPDLRSSQFEVTPDFVGGSLPGPFLAASRLAYSAFTRSSFRTRLVGRRVDPREVVEESPGEPGRVQGAVLDHRMTENWFGLSWAYPVLDDLGVGVTTFLAVRNQQTEAERRADAFNAAGETLGSLANQDFSYSAWRLLWKAGIKLEREEWRVGASVTSPGLEVFASGTSAATVSVRGPGGGAGPSARLAATDQRDLRADWKSGWAAAVGATYLLNRGGVHLAAEWHAPVEQFRVVDTQPFRTQTQGDTVQVQLLGALRSVVNVGAGAQWVFSPIVTGYGSFRTDFSAAPGPAESTVSVATWDLFHATIGAELHFKSFDLTFGGSFSFGSDTLGRDNTPIGNPLSPIPIRSDGRITFVRARLLIGFQLFIGGRRIGL